MSETPAVASCRLPSAACFWLMSACIASFLALVFLKTKMLVLASRPSITRTNTISRIPNFIWVALPGLCRSFAHALLALHSHAGGLERRLRRRRRRVGVQHHFDLEPPQLFLVLHELVADHEVDVAEQRGLVQLADELGHLHVGGGDAGRLDRHVVLPGLRRSGHLDDALGG